MARDSSTDGLIFISIRSESSGTGGVTGSSESFEQAANSSAEQTNIERLYGVIQIDLLDSGTKV